MIDMTNNSEDELCIEKVRIISMHAPITNAVAILVSLLFFYILYVNEITVLSGVWLGLMTITAFSRIWLWHNLDNRKSSEWLIKYTYLTAVLGFFWSAIFLFAVDPSNLLLVGSLLMLYFGITSAALPTLSIHLPAYFLYTIPSTLTILFALLRFDEQIYNILSFATFVFYSMMGLFAYNSNKNTTSMIRLKIKNQSLVDDLKNEMHQRDKIVESKTEQLRLLNLALFQSEDQLRNVINGANLGYWDWNYQTGDHEVNDRWLKILGLDRSDINNNVSDWGIRIHPDDKERMEAILERSIKDHTCYSADYRMKHKKGHWVWIEGSGAVVEYDESTNQPVRLCGTHEDVSQRKELENQLEYQATHDQLTGLFNRVELWKKLEVEINRSTRYQHDLSLFLIDIDHFKKINDNFGHKTGDSVLFEFAKVLQDQVRKTDFTSRYGGEEFLVILPETSLEKAEELAERLRQRVSETKINSGSRTLQITISIGIATSPQHGIKASELFDSADMAMYQAKENGRNCIKRARALSIVN